jgi:hypothetical protein
MGKCVAAQINILYIFLIRLRQFPITPLNEFVGWICWIVGCRVARSSNSIQVGIRRPNPTPNR